ncbi:peptidylprolyl isomerase [Neisseria gonorrhoeae]
MMKIKALMIAAALLAAADVHAAPQKAKTAPAKAVKAAATAQKEAAPAQQQGGIRFSDGIAAVADNEVITNRRLAEAVAEAKATLPEGAPLRQYRAQHILIKADSENAAVGAESTIRKIYDQARNGTDFTGLARRYSQDASAGNGGDLGWFADGVMVPAFEEAVHALKPGQVGAPVRTQFGWHIIKLNEVRDAGTPEERIRNSVRQYIFQQKAGQATVNLLRDLHSGAYVDIR